MRWYYLLFASWALIINNAAAKQSTSPDPEFDEILSQDIDNLIVTSAGKRSQALKDTAAAIYVITQEDIRRAGIYSIPEALRMVPGMQVAKVSSNRWAVSSRGFNGSLSNKLLVRIDGRTIYTPVFSGVYWDDQSTSINDIERIEMIRGPGASLYGANAVNGVINIITRSAQDTQGNLLSATATARGNGIYEARHGGKISANNYYRTYAQYSDLTNWFRGRGGFRMDGKTSEGNSYTLQGDAYGGQQDATLRTPVLQAPFVQTVSSEDDSSGGNILGRWSRKFSQDSELSVQGYVDHYSRNESNFSQKVSTADIEFQHSSRLNERNNFVWGGGARLYYENLQGTYSASVKDRYATQEIFNIFAQNEYAFIPKTLYLTLGSKFEHNDFTGFEVQPSGRMTWHFARDQMLWGAVSRAVRTPSSIEQDVSLLASVTGTTPLTETRIVSNPNQKAEELIAYELGHRIQLSNNASLDSTIFYNDFTNLQAISNSGTPFTGVNGNTVIPFMINNLGKAHIYGFESAASWNVSQKWQLGGSYTYLKLDFDVNPGTASNLESSEELAPRHQFSIQSYYNINERLHWDNMVYLVDALSDSVGGYMRYDTRIAYLIKSGMEVSLIGRNILGSHEEFPSNQQTQVDRSLIGQILWKF